MKRKVLIGLAAGGLAPLVIASPVGAQELSAADVQVNLDNIFVLLAGVLVIFMQAGFALVESGLTRAKNVANIMMKNLMDFCAGALAFFAVGFAFAFGAVDGGITDLIGMKGFFLGDGAAGVLNLNLATFFVFQVAFCATAATIVSGAMAERTKFKAYVLYSVVISAVIYPVVVHWVWGGGWLYQLGTPYHDFAGSSIVHMTGGIAAFFGARALGPRLGKYGPDGTPRAIPGHSIPFAVLGTFILLVGWYGFNPGSELAADGAVGGIALTTTIAAVAGAATAMLTTWLKSGKPDVGMTANGMLAGLVAITAGTAAVSSVGAAIIGAVAGALVVAAVLFFDRVKVDDPVGAISVHGVCGFFGVVCVGLFATQDVEGFWSQGLLYGGGFDQLVSQLIGLAAIVAWVSVTSFALFAALKATVGLRVSKEEELAGLDVEEHGSPGYAPDVVTGDPSDAGVSAPSVLPEPALT
ncbi:MAG: ammonium transporter [Acidimicrobiales bacterium]